MAKKHMTAQQKKFTEVAKRCMNHDASGSTLGAAMRAYGRCVKDAWRGKKRKKRR